MNPLDTLSKEALDRIERAIDKDGMTFQQRGRVNAMILAQTLRPDDSVAECIQLAEWILTNES